MQQTNQRKTQQSRCTYCGSISYGKGCRFGPHSCHFHPDDSTKCSYCGSSSYGKGCKLNPTSNLHVHGGVFNDMLKDSIQSFLDHKVFIAELKKDYSEFECYKLGIIDSQGNKIKAPITEQEKNSFGPMVKTLLKLKRYLGSKVELMEATNDLEKDSILLEGDITKYKKILEYQSKMDDVLSEMYRVIDEAQQNGLSLDEVKKLIKA
jgi:hypothetical protein